MSVNYNGNGWKQTLDPIIQNRKESDPDQKLELRKNTYSISSQEDRESNIHSSVCLAAGYYALSRKDWLIRDRVECFQNAARQRTNSISFAIEQKV